MRLHFVAFFVLVAFVSCVTSTESGVQKSNVISDSDTPVDHDKNVRRLRGDRKLTEEGELLVDNEERGISFASANNFVSRLTSRVNAKKFAGAKTEKLTGEQVKFVSREVAKEVSKNPKVWPTIKKGLKILYGTVLLGLIAVGVYGMVSAMRNYT